MLVTVRLQPGDLANIRFAVSPAVHLLTAVGPFRSRAAGRWWRGVCRHAPAAAAPVLELIGARPGFTPDFLTPSIALDPRRPAPSIADELEVMRSIDSSRLAGELELYDGLVESPRVVRALREEGRGVERLADSLYALYRSCLADDWPDIERRLRADLAYRAGVLAERGVGAMLGTLASGQDDHSSLMISGGCRGAGAVELALDGRGFLLSANTFLDSSWLFSIGPWQQPFLAYPALRAAEPTGGSGSGARQRGRDRDALVTLIGRGRAAALRAVGAGCTTGELAARLAVSAPTASVHASALREAGLLASARDGRAVVHTVTALGAGLLVANRAPGREL